MQNSAGGGNSSFNVKWVVAAGGNGGTNNSQVPGQMEGPLPIRWYSKISVVVMVLMEDLHGQVVVEVVLAAQVREVTRLHKHWSRVTTLNGGNGGDGVRGSNNGYNGSNYGGGGSGAVNKHSQQQDRRLWR